MCRQSDSAGTVQQAAADLTEACIRLCEDDVGKSLRQIYDQALSEEVPDYLKRLVERLQ